ncbi:MAG: hypothetical protein KGQ49_04190 [Verrucomicrobia bacterium]|nr:hypothetical protein [Verrucomicrobiota bacterium]
MPCVYALINGKRRAITLISPPLFVEAPADPSEQPNLPEPLRCDSILHDKIVRLFTTIADESVITNGLYLWNLGNDIEHTHRVHPFTFIMNMPRDKIQKIFNSRDFWYTTPRFPSILGGIERGMTREGWERLNPLIPSFASMMGKAEGPIRQKVQTRDWLGLVHYLFDIRV